MKHLKTPQELNEVSEKLNIFGFTSSKKFEVEIRGNDGKVIFGDIIDAKNLNDAFDKSTDIMGIKNITLHDEVTINIREIK